MHICKMDFFSKEEIEKAVENSNCLEEVLIKLGFKSLGRNIIKLEEKINEYKIDISHFGTLERDPNIKYVFEKSPCGRLSAGRTQGVKLIPLNELIEKTSCINCPSRNNCLKEKKQKGE